MLKDTALLSGETDKTMISNELISSEPTEGPSVSVFFSFKGGVGRTLHLVAFARELAIKFSSTISSPKILIVDADIEAPGLTWWAKDSVSLSYSYLDFLAEASSDTNTACMRAASQLKSMRLELGSTNTGVYCLPAFRTKRQIIRPHVLPEHLTHTSESPWIMGDLLVELGKQLKVDFVLVDLRAGLTELSSSLFLDPRLKRFVVTTTSEQSILGTEMALDELAKFAAIFSSDVRNDLAKSTNIVLSFIPPDYNENEISEIRSRFDTKITAIAEPKHDVVGVDYEESGVFLSHFDQSLLGLKNFQSALKAIINSSAIKSVVGKLSASWEEENEVVQNVSAKLTKLKEYAGKWIVADQDTESKDFLASSPYRNMAISFSNKIPSAVIMGAKGAGKSFLFGRLASIQKWSDFSARCGIEADVDSTIVPLYWSENAKHEKMYELQARALTGLGYKGDDTKLYSIKRHIRDSFSDVQDLNSVEWRRRWLEALCMLLDCSFGKTDDLDALFPDVLDKIDGKVTFIIDGLEDIFMNWSGQSRPNIPLRLLCQDILNDVSLFGKGNVGLLVFVRKDLARAAILQNFEQFNRLYSKYELCWNKEEALRLILWILDQSGVMLDSSDEHVGSLRLEDDYDVISKKLHKFWGVKLGGPQSREAYTDNWVLSAISDFNGNIQARDIVRLLETVSKKQLNKAEMQDRLVTPAALRDALAACGKAKIDDFKMETQVLASDLTKLENNDLSIPIEKDSLERIGVNHIDLMEEFGILLREGNVYYLPEIFRQGLGISLSKGARPKVVNLMRKALSG